MTNEVASVNLTPQSFPAGTISGNVVFTLNDSTGKAVATQTSLSGPADTTASTTFQAVAPGVGYTISAARVDNNNSPLATPVVSAPFNVASTAPVTITIPVAPITVSPQQPPASATLTIDFSNGFTNTQNLHVNGNNVLSAQSSKMTLSPAGVVHTGATVYCNTQQDITKFKTAFTFQMPNAQPGAEIAGLSFIIQNSNATTNPAGFGLNAAMDANGFGYGAFILVGGQTPIQNSVAVYFDMGASGQRCYPATAKGNSSTMGLAVNGGTDLSQGFLPTNDLNPAGIDLHSGHVFGCLLTYDGTILTAVVTDTVTGAHFRIAWPINISACCGGNKAWVGFGGANVVTTFGQEIDVLTWQFFEGNDPELSTPVFSVAPGSYGATQIVSLTSPEGAPIFYTVNGLPPTSASTPYTGPITVSSSQFIQAIAIKSGCMDSSVGVAAYLIGTTNHINLPSGFSTGDGVILCGNATRVGTTIQLTDTVSGGNETGTAWFGVPVPISSGFSTTFTMVLANAQANGVCFVLQNNNQNAAAGYNGTYGSGQLHVSGGPTAMGNNQNGMGYGAFQAGKGFVGLYSSVAVAFDLFTVRNSVGLYLDGVEPAGNQTPITGGLDITKGNPISVSLAYSGTTLTIALTDTVTNATFSHSWTVDIPGTIGQNVAYAGFTAGTGGATVNASIRTWTFS